MLALSAGMGQGMVVGPGIFCGDAAADSGVSQHFLHALFAGGGSVAIFCDSGAGCVGGGGDDDGARPMGREDFVHKTGGEWIVAFGTRGFDLAAKRAVCRQGKALADDPRTKSRFQRGPISTSATLCSKRGEWTKPWLNSNKPWKYSPMMRGSTATWATCFL